MKRNALKTLAVSATLLAFGSDRQLQPPALHQLGPVLASTTMPLGNVTSVRQLSNGRVLVNDIGARRLLLFDSTLSTPVVIADSAVGVQNAYGSRGGVLLPYRGDTTYLVDVAAPSMLLIDPAGKIGSVKSVPRPQDAGLIGVTSAFDGGGRLIYRGQTRAIVPATPPAAGTPVIPQQPDSAPIVRVDAMTRRLDTAGYIKVQNNGMTVTQLPGGGMMMTSKINPLPQVDDWAVLSDGSVAFVRGRDYHIDWINPDGSRTSTARMPFDWQRLDDAGKAGVLDSAKKTIDSTRAAAVTRAATSPGQTIVTSGAGAAELDVARAAAGAAGGGDVRIMVMAGGDGGGGAGGGARTAVPGGGGAPVLFGGGPTGAPLALPQVEMVEASQLPDYRPPFTANAVRADMDGNLWIRTAQTLMAQGFIYDVVNRKGEITDRIQIPPNSQIIGFGKGGTVYLGGREATGFKVMRAMAGTER